MKEISWAEEQDVIEDIINLAIARNEEDLTIKVETDCPSCGGGGTVKLSRDRRDSGKPLIICSRCTYNFPITQECPECSDVGALTTELWAAARV